MVKCDYGHLKCPFYHDRLENGIDVYSIPRDSDIKSAVVYLSKGGVNQASQVQGTKIPHGAMYVLAASLLDEELTSFFAFHNVKISLDIDYSYTMFKLTTLGDDLFLCLKKLMEKIASPSLTEEKLEKQKQEILLTIQEHDTPLERSKDALLDALYLASPIQESIYPTKEELNLIHASTLRKIQECYYTSRYITLFFSLPDDPRNVLVEANRLKCAKEIPLKEEPRKGEEKYDVVNEEYAEIESGINRSLLTYGFKFPSRKTIYEAYGESAFFLYELFADTAFLKNPIFLDAIADQKADLVKAEFKQGGEDAYFYLTFFTEEPEALVEFMGKFLARINNHVDKKRFNQLKEEYLASVFEKLGSPVSALEAFATSFPNHIAYTSLAAHASRVSFSAIKHFLGDFREFRRACCFAKKR